MTELLSPSFTSKLSVRAAIVVLFVGLLFVMVNVRQAIAATEPPETYLNAHPAENSASPDASFEFEGEDPDGFAVTSFKCQLDGGGFVDCASPWTYTGLADGAHTFEVKAVDADGDEDATPYSYPWSIDTVAPDMLAPETTISDGPPAISASSDVGFSFAGEDGGGSGVNGFECQLDGGGFSDCFSGQEYNSLSDGSHTFEVRAIDVAGNLDATPATWAWTVDTTPPDTVITNMPAGVTSSATASFEFRGDDPGGLPVAGFECQLDGAGFSECVNPQSLSGLLAGNHTFEVSAWDAAGNVDPTPASFTWTVDTPTGVAIGVCGGYTVLQSAPGQYSAPGWAGSIKVGTNGNDTLNGTNGPDLILGLGGSDRLDGKGGDDVICGGDGKDLMEGGAGNDYLDGGADHDLLSGQQGDYDLLYGGEGNDGLFDTDGVDGAHGGKGNDLFTIVLRYGWRDSSGAARFDQKLSGGYQDDTVLLFVLDRSAFYVNISGDEPENQPSQEGRHDSLALAGRFNPRPVTHKFEHQLVLSTGADAIDQVAAMEAQYAAEYGFTLDEIDEEGSQEDSESEKAQENRIMLPLVTN